VLFGALLLGAVAIVPLLAVPVTIGFVIAFMAMSVIGVHGMLSGVASQDFGGRRNAGTATGMIDGFVYFGGAFQAAIYGQVLPTGADAGDSSNWLVWPIAMIPMAVIGLGLSLSIYNARVQPKAPAH
jgi:OPA family glycerol-3-phosphate transporter-like MFS transporter